MGAPVPHNSLYILDPNSAAVGPGNAVVSQPGKQTVTLLTTAALAAGGLFAGIAITGYGAAPSGLLVQDSGAVDSAIANLGAGAAGPVYATAVGVLSRTVLGPILGTCDAFGNITLNLVQASALDAASGTFGDGSDGALVYDGVATILGMAPVGAAVYTLTRDIYASNLTINTGISVVTAGFRVFCSGTFTTLGTGSLTTMATLGVGGVGSAGTGGLGGAAGGTGTLAGGFAGGAGGAGNNVGVAGTNATAARGMPGQTAGAGGAGGAATNAGGAASTWSAMTAAGGSFRHLPSAQQGWIMSAFATVMGLVGGAGGGGGGADNADAGGGGGGTGGGVLILSALAIANAGSITANGGAGGAGFSTAHDAGGGGGGGGGVALVVSRVFSGNAPTAAGGLGGAKVGAGAVGLVGSAGTVVQIAA